MRPIKRLAPRSATLQMSRVMYLNYDPDLSRADLFREHRAFGTAFRDAVAPLAPPPACPRDPHRRLRIGYLSPDFRTHSVAYFVAPIFQAFDRARFETIGYAHVTKPDHVTEHLRSLASAWRDVSALDDAELARLIRADRIDIPGRARRLHQGQPPARVHRPARADPDQLSRLPQHDRPAPDRLPHHRSPRRPGRCRRLPRRDPDPPAALLPGVRRAGACAGGRAAAGPAPRPRDLRLVQQSGQGQRQGGRAVGRGAAGGAGIAPAAQGVGQRRPDRPAPSAQRVRGRRSRPRTGSSSPPMRPPRAPISRPIARSTWRSTPSPTTAPRPPARRCGWACPWSRSPASATPRGSAPAC